MNEDEMRHEAMRQTFEMAEWGAQLERKMSRHMFYLSCFACAAFILLAAIQIKTRMWAGLIVTVMWSLSLMVNMRTHWRDAHRLTPQERMDAMIADAMTKVRAD